jgi:hypothetical protein
MAEDGVFETHPHEGPPGFRPGPAAWLVHPPLRKAGDLNATVLPAHRLAGEPGALAGSPSLSAEPRIRTVTLLALNKAPLSSWASSACE